MKIKFKKFIFDNVLYCTYVHKSVKVVLQRGVCYDTGMPIFFQIQLKKCESESHCSPVLHKMPLIVFKLFFHSVILYASFTPEDFQLAASVRTQEPITLPLLLFRHDAKHRCYTTRATILRQVVESYSLTLYCRFVSTTSEKK